MKAIVKLLIILVVTSLSAQMTPEEVVQKQLEAYNSRNIEGFMNVIANNITFHDFSNGKITMQGYDACKEFYSHLFKASPALHSTILTRTVFGNRVIDHEQITGRNGNQEPLELVLIYEVVDEKISKITVLRTNE